MNPVLYTARCLLPITAPPIEDGALLVVDRRVVRSGRRRDLVAVAGEAQVVDFGDAVILPPLVNAHTHLELTDFPTWAAAAGEPSSPQGFVAWILHLVRVRQTISPALFEASLRNGLQASLRAGTGAIGDILTRYELAAIYRETPLCGKVFAEVLGQDASDVAARLETLAPLLARGPGAALGWGLSPHASYTLSAAAMSRAFAFAAEHTLPCAIHLAESREERHFIQDGAGAIAEQLYPAARWRATDPVAGASPVRALCRQGWLKAGDLVVHGVQVDGDDIDQLKRRDTHVVLCPRSNAALGVGKAPLAGYLKAGVPLALGTDSLASAPSLSVWEEMAFARTWFAGQASPRAWLDVATRGGAAALGLDDRLGGLVPESPASFQVVALAEPPGAGELEEALCSADEQARVTHLYLDGKNVLPES